MSETTDQPASPENTSAWHHGRHPVSIGHLVMGVAFGAIVVAWALIQGNVVTGRDIRWLLPIPWVLAGGAGLVAAALTSGRHATRVTGWVPAGPGATTSDTPVAEGDEQDTRQL